MTDINKELLDVIKNVQTLIEKVSSMDNKISEIHEDMKELITEQNKINIRVNILWRGAGILIASISALGIVFFKKLTALLALVS